MESLHLSGSPRHPHLLPDSPGHHQRVHSLPASPTMPGQAIHRTFSMPASPVMHVHRTHPGMQEVHGQQMQSPKLLHSLLYGFNQNLVSNGTASAADGRSISPCANNGMPPTSQCHDASPRNRKEDCTRVPTAVHRQRSGSIGSAGSSMRDSRSPSYDSSASSHDSLSRSSPISIGSSPSPSPPVSSESKLFGILKGTINTPYASLFQKNSRSPGCGGDVGLKRSHGHMMQDEPIDLSCKPKKSRHGSVGSDYGYHSTNSASSSQGSPSSEASKSILESILCRGRPQASSPSPSLSPCYSGGSGGMLGTVLGGGTYNHQYSNPNNPYSNPNNPYGNPNNPYSNPNNPYSNPSGVSSPFSSSSFTTGSKTPDSVQSPPTSPATSKPPESPKPHRCSGSQRVTLAKKMLLPISSRVSNWLYKLVQFAKSLPEFGGLPHSDQLSLLLNSWSRLMLLYMAETNFQFAVTPVREEEPLPTEAIAMSSYDVETPTMHGVEGVQCFIRKCQSMNLDGREYQFVRMVTLFHSGYSGLQNADFVEKVSNFVRQSLQDHIKATHPGEKLRYSNILLCLHTLYGINCKMVQKLFCKHHLKDADMDVVLKEMLQDSESFER